MIGRRYLALSTDLEAIEKSQREQFDKRISPLPNNRPDVGEIFGIRSSGDHIRKVTPVPIPNTAVKLSEPMIVHTSVKVGIAGF